MNFDAIVDVFRSDLMLWIKVFRVFNGIYSVFDSYENKNLFLKWSCWNFVVIGVGNLFLFPILHFSVQCVWRIIFSTFHISLKSAFRKFFFWWLEISIKGRPQLERQYKLRFWTSNVHAFIVIKKFIRSSPISRVITAMWMIRRKCRVRNWQSNNQDLSMSTWRIDWRLTIHAWHNHYASAPWIWSNFLFHLWFVLDFVVAIQGWNSVDKRSTKINIEFDVNPNTFIVFYWK